MDSPDQNANGIPVSNVTQNQDHITLEVAAIGGTFEGMIHPGADSMRGTWEQGGQTFPLNLKRMVAQDGRGETVRPQEPSLPYPYHVDSVTFENKTDHVKLAGTLTYPDGNGPFPALVLIKRFAGIGKHKCRCCKKSADIRQSIESRSFRGLNHLFQEANTGFPDEYSQIQQTFSPRALDVIGKWLGKHLK